MSSQPFPSSGEREPHPQGGGAAAGPPSRDERGGDVLDLLLVEDDSTDAALLRRRVQRAADGSLGALPQPRLHHVSGLGAALSALDAGAYDAVLLDLNLGDSRGLETFLRLHASAPGTPVVVLTGMENESLAVEAIRQGAQDYIGKDSLDGRLLLRTVRYAVERQRSEAALKRYTARLEVLRSIDRAILSAESVDDIAEAVLQRIRRLVPCRRASVLLLDAAAGVAQVLATHAVGLTRVGAGERIPTAGWSAMSDWEANRPWVCDELDRLGTPLERQLYREGIRSVVTVPLHAPGGLIGVLNLGFSQPRAVETEYVEVARELADLLAIAIHQGRLHERIRRHSEELEQRVSERTEQLRETNAELEAFAYTVSHDLRNPLWNIQGSVEALQEKCAANLGEEGREYLELVLESAESMDRMIQDLLRYSRVSREQVHWEPVDLEAAVDAAVSQYTRRIAETGAAIEVGRPLPVVRAHRATLEQVLTNLVSNALKFVAPTRTPRIRIAAEVLPDRVRLWVEDNGIGISSEARDAIFTAFERVESQYPGSGVGLATVRRAVERMGGRVGVESEPGAGSRFWVELPQADVAGDGG